MPGEQDVCAVLVVRGDRVKVQGAWHEVRASRLDRSATGGAVIVLTLAGGSPLRVPVFLRPVVSRRDRDPEPGPGTDELR
ncbi:hypothetical protein [Streptomyces sp. NBC_00388]|uniref:hypothetical protein n=1 Tax=Streptomyces sp. NBC_00388 TaxID=2975735 RepID=UPI002E1D0E9B